MPRKKKQEDVIDKVEDIVEDAVEEVGKEVKKIVKKVVKIAKDKPKKTSAKKKDKIVKKIDKKKLAEKAKKLAEKIKTEDIKEKLVEAREEEKERKKTLVPIEDYVRAGVHVGTKVITPHIRTFVYRRRNDGIAIINTNFIDQRIKEMIDFLKEYEPEDFIVICKREAGWKAVEKFSELTGVRIFTKKYPAGILTNTSLPDFFETDAVFICDPWLDKNALKDAQKIRKKVFALCDTNNYAFGIDFFIPCNNKSSKGLGMIFYLLARGYLKAKKIKEEVKIEDFVEFE